MDFNWCFFEISIENTTWFEMDFHWYFIEISTGIHWNDNWILFVISIEIQMSIWISKWISISNLISKWIFTLFPMDLHWYFIEFSIGFLLKLLLNFNRISNRSPLVFHSNFNWISNWFPLVFQSNIKWIPNGFQLLYHWNFIWYFIEI